MIAANYSSIKLGGLLQDDKQVFRLGLPRPYRHAVLYRIEKLVYITASYGH